MRRNQSITGDYRTRFPLFDHLRRYCKNRQNLNHNLYDNVRHSCRLRNFCIGLQPLEEVLNAFEDVNENVVTSSNVLGRLNDRAVMVVQRVRSTKILTKSRTPIPAKTTLAGENI